MVNNDINIFIYSQLDRYKEKVLNNVSIAHKSIARIDCNYVSQEHTHTH